MPEGITSFLMLLERWDVKEQEVFVQRLWSKLLNTYRHW